MWLEPSTELGFATRFVVNSQDLHFFRYGGEAGNATENALSTAGNAYLTAYNAAALGPKGLAKRMAKNTGKVLVKADQEPPNVQNDSGADPDQKAITLKK